MITTIIANMYIDVNWASGPGYLHNNEYVV